MQVKFPSTGMPISCPRGPRHPAPKISSPRTGFGYSPPGIADLMSWAQCVGHLRAPVVARETGYGRHGSGCLHVRSREHDICVRKHYERNHWLTFDARVNEPRIRRIVVGRGRDAADVPIVSTLGPAILGDSMVHAADVAVGQ